MLEKVLNLLSFGCRHAHMSVPFSMDMARQHQVHLDWTEELPAGLLPLRCVPGLRTALRL